MKCLVISLMFLVGCTDNPKYKILDKVEVTCGLYKGCKGRILGGYPAFPEYSYTLDLTCESEGEEWTVTQTFDSSCLK